MSQLSDTLDHLYTQFLLRDILAKFVPGLLTLSFAFALFSPRLFHHAVRGGLSESLVANLVLYAIAYMGGMLLQFIGTSLGLTRIHVWGPEGSLTGRQVSLEKARELMERHADRPAILRARERFAILKEMAGNFGVAILTAILLVFVRVITQPAKYDVALGVVLGVLAVVVAILLCQNQYHADEQRLWEEAALLPIQPAPRSGLIRLTAPGGAASSKKRR